MLTKVNIFKSSNFKTQYDQKIILNTTGIESRIILDQTRHYQANFVRLISLAFKINLWSILGCKFYDAFRTFLRNQFQNFHCRCHNRTLTQFWVHLRKCNFGVKTSVLMRWSIFWYHGNNWMRFECGKLLKSGLGAWMFDIEIDFGVLTFDWAL